MPIRLYAPAPGQLDFQQVPSRKVQPHEIRLRTYYTGIRHGMDLRYLYDPSFPTNKRFPWTPSAWGVGELIEVGEKVSRYTIGDWVHGPMQHEDEFILPESRVYPVNWLRREFPLFVDPGVTALRSVREARINYGDRVAILGLGTVGLMALQFVLHSGAREVIAIDAIESRTKVAQRLGAHTILTLPVQWNLLKAEIHEMISGVDCILDFTGDERIWQFAPHTIPPECTLVIDGQKLHQANLEKLRATVVGKGGELIAIYEDHSDTFLEQLVIESIAAKKVIVWPIHSHTCRFADAPQVYQKITEAPEKHIKILGSFEKSVGKKGKETG
jgi:threonine dehydrogenase-like Zn-dependent dehydrogenase